IAHPGMNPMSQDSLSSCGGSGTIRAAGGDSQPAREASRTAALVREPSADLRGEGRRLLDGELSAGALAGIGGSAQQHQDSRRADRTDGGALPRADPRDAATDGKDRSDGAGSAELKAERDVRRPRGRGDPHDRGGARGAAPEQHVHQKVEASRAQAGRGQGIGKIDREGATGGNGGARKQEHQGRGIAELRFRDRRAPRRGADERNRAGDVQKPEPGVHYLSPSTLPPARRRIASFKRLSFVSSRLAVSIQAIYRRR